MEWVETTAKSLEEAKELALDRLGVAADEAEFEILEEPRAGLFGRMRGEARVRARVMPTAVRPKQDRRTRGRAQRDARGKGGPGRQPKDRATDSQDEADDAAAELDAAADDAPTPRVERGRPERTSSKDTSSKDTTPKGSSRAGRPKQKQQKEQQVNTQDADESEVAPAEVAEAAKAFMSGLAAAFGTTADTTVEIDGTDIDVRVTGSELGLMVGHGGRTLMAVQDLARVASQRRLGDHDTRLRIDVGGYREKRGEALGRFAIAVAQEVLESGTAKALEPMQSADRKIVHDALASVEGVTSRSEGDDPMRRVVITPA
jgi:spoIIIJ-associated protein